MQIGSSYFFAKEDTKIYAMHVSKIPATVDAIIEQ